jgi:hypothetical protein
MELKKEAFPGLPIIQRHTENHHKMASLSTLYIIGTTLHFDDDVFSIHDPENDHPESNPGQGPSQGSIVWA